MVTRRIDVFDPAVVTVGAITAGTTNNVIPETAEIEGTIRAVSETHPGQGPRRHPPRRRRHRRRPRRAPSRSTSSRATRSRSTTTTSPTFALGVADDVVGQRPGRPPAPPGHGRRGLELRPPAGAGGDDVPRRHRRRPQPGHGARRTTPTGSCSTSRRWRPASPPTPPSPCITWPDAHSSKTRRSIVSPDGQGAFGMRAAARPDPTRSLRTGAEAVTPPG